MKQVKIVDTDVVRLDDVSTTKGYVMKGIKGDFLLAKDTNGRYIWVSLDPARVTKPVHSYGAIKEAIRSKINDGYEVFEFTKVTLA